MIVDDNDSLALAIPSNPSSIRFPCLHPWFVVVVVVVVVVVCLLLVLVLSFVSTGFDLLTFAGSQQNKRRESLDAENHPIREQLQHPKDLGRYLKFLNREESINQLLVHAQKQFRFYDTGYGEKDFQFTTCSGGLGLGKVTSQSAFLVYFFFWS